MRSTTYQDGVLTKYKDTVTQNESTHSEPVRRMTYSTVAATKKAAKVIQKQQQELINGDYGLNLYLGFYYIG